MMGFNNNNFAIKGETFWTAFRGKVDPPNIHNGNKNLTHTVPIRNISLANVAINSPKNPENIAMLINMSVNFRGAKAVKSNLLLKIIFPIGKMIIVKVIVLIAHINTELRKMIYGFAGNIK
jgi:hypothetical protein